MWVMDRGIPTEEILQEMRDPAREIFYLVGTPKGKVQQYEKKWLDLPWQKVRESVEVKLFEQEGELYVLAKSEGRQANRHRGTGRPASPATPPDMRVRIRRFGGLSRPHDHRRKPELVKVGIRQSDGESGRVRNPPRAVRTPGSLCRQVFTDAPLAEFAKTCPSALPLLPHHRPKSTA